MDIRIVVLPFASDIYIFFFFSLGCSRYFYCHQCYVLNKNKQPSYMFSHMKCDHKMLRWLLTYIVLNKVLIEEMK